MPRSALIVQQVRLFPLSSRLSAASTMLAGIYCSVGDHWFYTSFHNALWETTSAPKRVYNLLLNIWTTLQNWKFMIKWNEWFQTQQVICIFFTVCLLHVCFFQYYHSYRRSVCVTALDLQDRGRLVFTSFLLSGHMNHGPSINHTVYQTGVQICSDSWHTTADPTSFLPLTFPFPELLILSLFFSSAETAIYSSDI